MLALSTPEPRPATRRRWLDVGAFVVVPVAAALVFVAVLVGERTGVDDDLQLVAPNSARPGGAVALRAMLFTNLDRIEGAESVEVPVRVRLLTAEGSIAEAELAVSDSMGMEGVLQVPDDASGRMTVRAEASFGDGRQARADAPLTVEDPARPLGEPGRALHPLQRYTLFPTHPAEGAVAPAALEPRVLGGACVPERPCRILVRVGAPAAEVAFAPTAALTVQTGPEPTGATTGLVAFTVVTHGPDVTAEVVASRDGIEVARRQVRLPLMLGGFPMRVSSRLMDAPASPTLAFEGVEADRSVIVDAYRSGIWERTGSIGHDDLDGGEGEVSLPFDALGPGIWRIQARTDPWGTNSAAVAFVHVAAPGTESTASVAAVADHVRELEYDLDYSRVAASSGAEPERAAAFLFAPPELDVLPLPQAMSGHMQATFGLDERKVQLRWGGALAFVLAGLFVVVVVMRRGLGAAAQARAVLAQAGDADAQSREARRRMTLTVIAVAAALALMFVAAGMLLVARGGV